MPATATKERPILFSAPMIKALLEGRKTQTRRIVKPQPDYVMQGFPGWHSLGQHVDAARTGIPALPRCPYGQTGDRLWVKETFWIEHDSDSDGYQSFDCGIDIAEDEWARIQYCATPAWETPPACEHQQTVQPFTGDKNVPQQWWLAPPENWDGSDADHERRGEWICVPAFKFWSKRPSIHMPRRASRIMLEITDVRVQRVEEISEEDAMAEGIGRHLLDEGRGPAFGLNGDDEFTTARDAFLNLFYDINKRAKRGSNPWVWALTFKKV